MKYNLSLFIKLVLVVSISFGAQQNLSAQEYEYKKNSIYASYGTAIFFGQFSISAERTVYQREMLRCKAKLNYGKVSKNNLDLSTGERIYRSYYGGSGVLVFGLFEMSLGVARAEFTRAMGFSPVAGVDYDEVFTGMIFQGNAGIRYEKEEFLLRAGVGNRELLYVGFGFSF